MKKGLFNFEWEKINFSLFVESADFFYMILQIFLYQGLTGLNFALARTPFFTF